MRTKYHRQHNGKRHFSRVLLTLLIISILLGVLSTGGFLPRLIQGGYISTISGVESVQLVTQDLLGTLTPKSDLIRENQKLRTEVQELYIATLYNQTLELENTNLRRLLTANTETAGDESISTLARIVDYREIPYGTLLAKAEDATVVTKGSFVYFGKWAIGKVTQVNGSSLLIKLFTASGDAYDVLLGEGQGTLIGTSNGTGKIILPRTEKVAVGTPVALPSAGGALIGIVANIERSEEEAMQTILVRIPFNINTLRFITIQSQ